MKKECQFPVIAKRSDRDRDNSFSRQSTTDTNLQSPPRKVSRAIVKSDSGREQKEQKDQMSLRQRK